MFGSPGDNAVVFIVAVEISSCLEVRYNDSCIVVGEVLDFRFVLVFVLEFVFGWLIFGLFLVVVLSLKLFVRLKFRSLSFEDLDFPALGEFGAEVGFFSWRARMLCKEFVLGSLWLFTVFD